MGNTIRRPRIQRVLAFTAVISLLSILPGLGSMEARPSYAQSSGWSTPVHLSKGLETAWFPYVAVDSAGGVHVIWDGVDTRSAAIEHLRDLLYYTSRGGETWSTPNDVAVVPYGRVIRAALACDNGGKLHMVYRDDAWLYYKQAPADDAWSAATWTSPHIISGPDSYLPDIAIDSQGTIHVVWTKGVGLCPNCFPVCYRRSTDGGRTWSYPRQLSPRPAHRSRLQIVIDSQDSIYVVWNEVDERGELVSSAYTRSSDRGESWSPPVHFVSPVGRSWGASIGVDGEGRVVAVWKTDQDDHIYYQLSSDGGISWSAPAIIGGILARSRLTLPGQDKYDMATDSGGKLHLVVVGRTAESEDAPGVYHLEWDGTSWSPATLLFAEPDLFPEYPGIAIGEGNRLHAVWFTRDRDHLWDSPNGLYEVWYSSALSTAPHVTARSTPVPSPTSTPTVMPMATTSPTVQEPARESTSGNGQDWHSVSMYPLGVAIAPVALLLLGLVIARSRWMFR